MSTSTRDEPQRQRLGRGLAALLGEVNSEAAVVQQHKGQRRIPLELIRPNPANPRKAFSGDELEGLAESIRRRGVLQPILVRLVAGTQDSYEIIAGERRWRAAQIAGVFDVPVSVIEATDRQALEIAIVENVQRTDLNPIEEAQGYQKLCVDFGYSHADLAREIGKSRSHVANTLRLLNLPSSAYQLLIDGSITAGHARALLTAANPDALAQQVVSKNLSVRDVERLARMPEGSTIGGSRDTARENQKNLDVDVHIQDMAATLTDTLGMSVAIRGRGAGGTVLIQYESPEQLERISACLLS